MLNCVLVMGACAIIGLSIYLFILEKTSDLFDWGFLAVGLYVGLLAVSAFRLKKSPGWLWCYLVLLVIIFASMIILAIWFFADRDKLVDNVA